MNTRSMVLIAPAILLVLLIGLAVRQAVQIEELDGNEDKQKSPAPSVENSAPITSSTSEPVKIPERGIWQISHDWIEIDPEVLRRRQEARRKTFGFNANTDPADTTDCADSNCRACLIDFVYGREF